MTQVSKFHLEQTIQKQLYDELSFTISELKDKKEVDAFLSEFLTKTERIMLAKRLGIAVLLIKGYSYRSISKVLRVSFPTIRSIQFWLDHGGKEYKSAVDKIILKEDIKKFFNKVDFLIDTIKV